MTVILIRPDEEVRGISMRIWGESKTGSIGRIRDAEEVSRDGSLWFLFPAPPKVFSLVGFLAANGVQ